MIVKIGNQSFDSTKIPIALLLTEKERQFAQASAPKGDSEFHLFSYFPGDVPPQTMVHWLRESCPEIDLTKTGLRLGAPGKPL